MSKDTNEKESPKLGTEVSGGSISSCPRRARRKELPDEPDARKPTSTLLGESRSARQSEAVLLFLHERRYPPALAWRLDVLPCCELFDLFAFAEFFLESALDLLILKFVHISACNLIGARSPNSKSKKRLLIELHRQLLHSNFKA